MNTYEHINSTGPFPSPCPSSLGVVPSTCRLRAVWVSPPETLEPARMKRDISYTLEPFLVFFYGTLG